MVAYIVFGVGLLFIAVLFWVIIRTVPDFCQNCHKELTRFFRLSPNEQDKIRSYFKEHEDRDIDEDGVFVCSHCKFVHDDFSGEKHSRNTDHAHSIEVNGVVYKSAHWKTLCKVCGLLVSACDPANPDIKCRACETYYHWLLDEESGYYFFRIIGDKKVTGIPGHVFGQG